MLNASLSITPPSGPVAPGASFTLTATLANTGDEVWPSTTVNKVGIGSQNPQDNYNWGPARVYIPSDLAPGQSIQLQMLLTAPVSPGTFLCTWRPVKDYVAWFGPTVDVTVVVQPGTSPPPPSPPPPPSGDPRVKFVLPSARQTAGDLLFSRVFDTGRCPPASWQHTFWKNTTGKRLRVHKTYTWIGVDLQGGQGDVACRVYRCTGPAPVAPDPNDPFKSGLGLSALLGNIDWDHYAQPTIHAGVDRGFDSPLYIEPDEYLWMMYANACTGQSHHVFEMWFTVEEL